MFRYFVVLILPCLAIATGSFGQQTNESQYKYIDDYVNSTPDIVSKNINDLAAYLISPYDCDGDKVRAIYFWVADNISYSVKKMRSPYTFSDRDEIVESALKSRKCVCQGYAELFHALCSASGIESFVISGYVKRDGEIGEYSHAWNSAKIDGRWYLFDPTWGSGYVDNNRFYPLINNDYFMVEPSEFILTHSPFDPLWQFLYYPLTQKDFYLNTIPDTTTYFDFNDTIMKYYCLVCPELQKMYASYNRIVENGIVNELILDQAEQARLNIAISLNNYASELLNQAIDSYNVYVAAKNSGFKGVDSDLRKMESLLDDCESDLDEARNIFSSVQTNDKGLRNSLRDNLQIVLGLSSNVNTEQRFLKRYMKERG